MKFKYFVQLEIEPVLNFLSENSMTPTGINNNFNSRRNKGTYHSKEEI